MAYKDPEKRREYQKKYRENNRGKTLEWNRKNLSKLRAKRKESGLCIECGKKKDRSFGTRCVDCLSILTEHAERMRKRRLEQGLCANCGKKKDTNITWCKACIEIKSQLAKERKKERLEKGLCYKCGGFKDTETQKCSICSEKQAEYMFWYTLV